MINVDFILLKEFVLENNQYFNLGFANVYLDDLTGLIYQGESFEKFAIGINDTFGNYFYLRTDPDIRYVDTRIQLSDNKRTIDEIVHCYLVAIVENAKPKELVQCLLDTLLKYGNERIRPVRSIYIREAAVAKELKKLSKEHINQVLQNLGTRQVAIIEFDFITTYSPISTSCLPNPCNTDSYEQM